MDTGRIRAVIFDLFGTLVENFSFRRHQDVLSEMASRLSAPHEDFIRLWVNETWNLRGTGVFPTVEANLDHVCRKIGLRPDPVKVKEALHAEFEFTRRSLAPREESILVLSGLRMLGYNTGLVSNCSPDVPVLWPQTPFAPFIDVAVFSCSAGILKPDSRIYHLACERLGVTAEDCLYVGDGSDGELSGAASVGMRPVLLRIAVDDTYDANREDWRGPSVTSLKEILPLIV